MGFETGFSRLRVRPSNRYAIAPLTIPGSPANIKKINEYCSNVQFNVQMIVNVKEIQDIIHAMPIGKAPGYDSVSNKHKKSMRQDKTSGLTTLPWKQRKQHVMEE